MGERLTELQKLKAEEIQEKERRAEKLASVLARRAVQKETREAIEAGWRSQDLRLLQAEQREIQMHQAEVTLSRTKLLIRKHQACLLQINKQRDIIKDPEADLSAEFQILERLEFGLVNLEKWIQNNEEQILREAKALGEEGKKLQEQLACAKTDLTSDAKNQKSFAWVKELVLKKEKVASQIRSVSTRIKLFEQQARIAQKAG